MATVKPIDKETLLQAVLKSKNVFTLEEHSLIGGLGSACLEALIDTTEPEKLPPIHRVGLADRFIHKYGDQRSLFELYGLMPDQIVEQIRNKIKRKVN
jgi:transketolase C-terminal domain/subunit